MCLLYMDPRNAKFFPSRKAHRAAQISVSLAISQTPVYTARPWMMMMMNEWTLTWHKS